MIKCPECKELKKIKKFGVRWGRNTVGKRVKKQQYQCNTCGRIFIEKLI
jgi:transposase-like protein